MPASTVMMPDLTKSPVVCVRKMEHEEGRREVRVETERTQYRKAKRKGE